jgi:uncharacterized phage-associated protein
MLSCYDVAGYFLAQQDEESEDSISNLKLQKLCYYAQGFNLAMHGEPLFPQEIRAWKHGPVVPELYHKYKGLGLCLAAPEGIDFSKFDADARELMDEVYTVYGQFSAWKLRNMTHAEPPWQKTEQDEVIPHNVMADYFKTLLE